MYTLTEISLLKAKAKSLKLIDYEILNNFSDEDLQGICNGIGAEWFSTKLRKIINNINPSFEATALIHDLHYHMKYGFLKANSILLANGIIEAKATYSWYNPLRYIALLRVRTFYNACVVGGSCAYNNISTKEKS